MTPSPKRLAAKIVSICEQYPGCVLLVSALAQDEAWSHESVQAAQSQAGQPAQRENQRLRARQSVCGGVVSCEVNAHGTSQYCCRCGARGERFSRSGQSRTVHRGGKLFRCPACGYEAQADFNASVNVHHSFRKEWHWQPRKKPSPQKLIAGEERRPVRLEVGWEKDKKSKPADPSQARLQTSRHGK